MARKSKWEHELEKDWCDWVLKEFKHLELIPIKFEPRGRTGYPDRLVFLPNGRVFLIEFKREGEKPRPLQLHRHKQLRKLQHVVRVADNIETAKRQFKKAVKEALAA